MSLPADEYLKPDELATLKGVLDEQLKDILSQSKDAVSELVEVREADADPLDLAVTESNRDFTLRMAERERKLLSKIRYALERIQNGEYGVCESCGAPITFGRLMARPVATLCIDCKTEAEQVEPKKKMF
ncbi:MAG: RNA polymerase-binding protein DksA [Alphaproteobacteria bacterium]|nr:RNA polymerase-binding protein DksA [Alphaproteobacteria bacterium]